MVRGEATMAHQRRSIAMLVLVAFGVLEVVDVASATEYGVGGDTPFSWTIPTTSNKYEDWVAKKTFVTNDVLVFSYMPGTHDVLRVTEAAYENCTITDPIDKFESGNDKITLVDSEYYFICGISIHCTLNQKVHVTVSKAATPSPTAKDRKPPTPGAAPSPGSSSASGLPYAGASICSALMVVVASLVL